MKNGIFIAVLVIALAACAPAATTATADIKGTAVSAAWTGVALTPNVPPTKAPTVFPTATPSPLTSIPLPFMALDGLRVAYISKGNLYVQDSGKQALQLTSSGRDRTPAFSDDGQKIVFYRGRESEKNQVYVINADGTGERALVTPDLLITLSLGYNEFTELHSLAFVPDTHQLLFNTHQLSTVNPKEAGGFYPSNKDLLIVDTDTGEIKRLMEPGQGGDFLISPDGKWIAIQTPDHVDVIDIQGRIVRNNLVTYSPDDYEYTWAPMYWTQDSNELIIVQPIPVSEIATNRGWPPLRTIWRYSLDGSPGIEIRLNPPPIGEVLSVSPDGDWIAYSYELGLAVADWDPGAADGVYLGNLRNGTSQLLYTPQLNEVTGFRDEVPVDYDGWSRDSTHFIFRNLRYRIYLGNIHGEIASIGGGIMLGWIDKNRYLNGGGTLGEVGKEEKVRVIELPTGLVIDNSDPIAFVFLGH